MTVVPFMPRKPGGGEIAVFHTLRGLCALLVVVVHTFPIHFASPRRQAVSQSLLEFGGAYAVCCFFLLSGFLVCLSMEREASAARFLWRRAVRLMPVYWACLAAAAAALIAQRYYLPDAGMAAAFGPLNAQQLFSNAFLVHDVFETRPIIPPVWSLFVEWKFYFLLASLKLARQDLRSARTVVIAAGLPLLFSTVPYESIEPYLWKTVAWQILMFKEFGIHVTFMFLGVAWARWHSGVWSLRKFLTTSTAIVAILLVTADEQACRHHDALWACRYLSAYAAAMLTFAALYAIRLRNVLGRVGVLLGDASYPLYCLHVPLMNVILFTNAVKFHLNVWMVTLIGDFAILCLAYAMHRWVEAPTLAWSRRWHRSNAAPVAPARTEAA